MDETGTVSSTDRSGKIAVMSAGQSVAAASDDTGSGKRPVGRRPARRGFPHGLASILIGLVLWEALVRLMKPDELVIVPPSKVLSTLVEMFRTGTINEDLSVSMQAFIIGYLLSALVAVPIGIAIGSNDIAYKWASPWVSALYATPIIGLAPLFVIIFGFTLQSKVAVVVALAIFPIMINTVAGARSVGQDYRELAIVYRAGRLESFRRVLLPGSMPFVLTGLRLAVGRGLIAVVVADLFGASAGLGLNLQRSASSFNTADIYAVTLLLAFLGISLSSLLEFFERRAYRARSNA